MMRPGLAYVVNSLNPGGTERLVVEMALAFSQEYRVCVFCLDEPGRWANHLRLNDIPVYALWREPGVDVRMPLRLAAGIRDTTSQIIHAHQCTPWFYSALSRLYYRKSRLLLEEHGRFYPEEDHPTRRLFNRLLISRLTDHFVAVSDDVRRRLARYEGLDTRRIEVIYNGVSSERPLTPQARELQRREWGFGPGDFVVGTVGRFDPIKNLSMLIEAIGRARENVPRVRGVLVGDGPELGRIRALIERSSLDQTIRLTGFRDDARKLVQSLDLFVLSSLSEGTSMALLEAMQQGVPVAVTGVGGNPEVVIADKTGWVIESRAAEALSHVITEAASDPGRCRMLANAGARRFQERFTFERMIDEYRRVYRSILKETDSSVAGKGSVEAPS